LLDYDQQHRTMELAETLAAYLTHIGSYDQTAEALNIQRGTLRYRLRSVRDLLQHDRRRPAWPLRPGAFWTGSLRSVKARGSAGAAVR
jgi:hypothetical protein